VFEQRATHEEFISVELIDLARCGRRLHLLARDHEAARSRPNQIDMAISLVVTQFNPIFSGERVVGDLDASSPFDFSGFVLPDSGCQVAVRAYAAPTIADIVPRGAKAIEEGGGAHGGDSEWCLHARRSGVIC